MTTSGGSAESRVDDFDYASVEARLRNTPDNAGRKGRQIGFRLLSRCRELERRLAARVDHDQYGVRIVNDDRIIPVAEGTADVLGRRFDPEDATFYRRTVTYGEWEAVDA